MDKRKLLFATLAWTVLLLACAGTPKEQPPDPARQENLNRLQAADNYLSSGRSLEEKGDLAAALEQYKLVLTIDPDNSEAREKKELLSQKLSQMAEEHYQEGLKYHKQGKYGQARLEFLMALKFNPEHPEAYQMVAGRQPDKNFVYHVIKPGESLSLIAKQYYGDIRRFDVIAKYNNIADPASVAPGQRIMVPKLEGVDFAEGMSRADDETAYVEYTLRPGESISQVAKIFYGDYKHFHVIAQFNAMEDATRVSAGQKVKVPKVAGLPFNVEAARASVPPTDEKKPEPYAPPPPPQPAAAAKPAVSDREAAIQLCREGKYKEAIAELNKVLASTPKDSEARKYMAIAHFENGKQLFDQQAFKEAQEAFENSKQYNPKCDQCPVFIENSKKGLLLVQRKRGVDHFTKSEYRQAIAELTDFLKNSPQDKEARATLSKSFFQQSLYEYNQGQFLEAKKGFESALAYDSTCEKCASYINQSETNFKEKHYNKGIVHFGKEQLTEAISEWEMVQKIDPNYKDVEENLKKAKSLQKKLEKIKKSAGGS